jgi:hypothetical protein
VQHHVDQIQGAIYAIVLTDDNHRSELYEAVKALRGHDGMVLVFITPSVFFESPLSDLETAYADYKEFESFRKRLNQLPEVSAFEVGQQDRVAGLLRSSATRVSTSGGGRNG